MPWCSERPCAWGVALLQAPECPLSVPWNGPSAPCRACFGVHLPSELTMARVSMARISPSSTRTSFASIPTLDPGAELTMGASRRLCSLTLPWAAYQIRHSLGPGFTGWQRWTGQSSVHSGLETGATTEPIRQPHGLEYSRHSLTWTPRSSSTDPYWL